MAVRVVRVVTEVAAVDRAFDYELGPASGPVGLGDRVRVDFHGRSVRGWVVATDVTPETGAELKTVKKWLGYGPPGSMLGVLRWAGERWYGSWSRFLLAASPGRVVASLPVPPEKAPLDPSIAATARSLAPGVIALAPTSDPLAIVLGAYQSTRAREGSLLVLVPSEAWAQRLRGRLAQRGCAVAHAGEEWDRARAGWPVVVGARGAALAPVPRLAGAIVLDADDEAYRSSASPTWHARDVVRERCRGEDAPFWATSMMPSPELLGEGRVLDVGDQSGGWPRVRVLDRRRSDPREGVLARPALVAAHHALEGDEPIALVVILQRLGAGRLLACARCGELTRCGICAQAEGEVGEQLACVEGHERRERFCRACGSTKLKRVRSGVTTLARDVGLQLGRPVSEVTAATDVAVPLERVVVGTEAVWSRVRRAGLVVFCDFDQYLLAPRASARRAAVHAVGRAGRLVGSRREGRAEVMLQTRRGDDPVVNALVSGSFESLVAEDVAESKVLGLPPFGALAEVTGEGASAFVAGLSEVSVRATSDGFVLRAHDAATLARALARAERPAARLRVAVA